jgi:hypothetical protein
LLKPSNLLLKKADGLKQQALEKACGCYLNYQRMPPMIFRSLNHQRMPPLRMIGG